MTTFRQFIEGDYTPHGSVEFAALMQELAVKYPTVELFAWEQNDRV